MISIVTWFTTGRKHFTGPQIEVENINVVHGLTAVANEGSGDIPNEKEMVFKI